MFTLIFYGVGYLYLKKFSTKMFEVITFQSDNKNNEKLPALLYLNFNFLSFQISFGNEMTRLDGKLTEIRDSLEFGREVLSRENVPEILNVEQLLEGRFRELSTPFRQMLDLTVVGYTPNDVSSLRTFPGKLSVHKQHRTILISSRREGSD